MNNYKENVVQALAKELESTIDEVLVPAAKDLDPESAENLKAPVIWKPLVLVLGNYSSGKSTLINELCGEDVQATGQAPTDDSFTVITGSGAHGPVGSLDGHSVLSDAHYPFTKLKKYGERFISHFNLKECESQKLEHVAIIDTPGMLDSITEKDRGYPYMEVIGDLAEMSDLILVLFDPHKAGTIRETYESLRHVLPKRTFENRMVFVLNRIDECENLNDLLRVYGSLCWNLSQMTGRKDIPPVFLTYAEQEGSPQKAEFLKLLQNDRDSLKSRVLDTPRHRLDYSTSYVERHVEKLHFIATTLLSLNRRASKSALGSSVRLFGALVILLSATGIYVQSIRGWGLADWTHESSRSVILTGSGGVLGLSFIMCILLWGWHTARHRKLILDVPQKFADLSTEKLRGLWSQTQNTIQNNVLHSHTKPSELRRHMKLLKKIEKRIATDIRAELRNQRTK